MSSESGKCRWQDCSRDAIWGSEFCFVHRPMGGDVFTSTVCAVAKWAGSAAAGTILIHFLKLIPHIGIIFNEHPDLVTALTNHPDDDTLNRAISLLAEAEAKQQVPAEAARIELDAVEYMVDLPPLRELGITMKRKGVREKKLEEML